MDLLTNDSRSLIDGILLLCPTLLLAGGYQNFKVAVYSRAYETREMVNLSYL